DRPEPYRALTVGTGWRCEAGTRLLQISGSIDAPDQRGQSPCVASPRQDLLALANEDRSETLRRFYITRTVANLAETPDPFRWHDPDDGVSPARRNTMSLSQSQRRVAVVGGGVAGLASACALAQDGYAVELFERRPYV